MKTSESPEMRGWIARAFTAVEDIVYLGLALLLTVSAVALLFISGVQIVQSLLAESFAKNVVQMLDQILLILLIVELLYTVQVSFREHTIVPGPFLLVGLIAAIRRILILSAEFGETQDHSDDEITRFLIELGAFTVLIVALVVCIRLLSDKRTVAEAERG